MVTRHYVVWVFFSAWICCCIFVIPLSLTQVYSPNQGDWYIQVDSRLLCNAMEHPVGQKIPIITLWEGFRRCVWPLRMHFGAILTQQMAITSWIGKKNYKFKLVLNATHKKLVVKYQENAKFPLLCLAFENAFLSYFHSKNSHNSVENYCTKTKLNLF